MPTKKKTPAQQITPSRLSAATLAVKLTPLMTEKTAHLAGSSVYAFKVLPSARRIAIGQAFKEMYGVLPTRVNILRVHGKTKRFGRVTAQRSDWKKAYIAVPAGTHIDLFANV